MFWQAYFTKLYINSSISYYIIFYQVPFFNAWLIIFQNWQPRLLYEALADPHGKAGYSLLCIPTIPNILFNYRFYNNLLYLLISIYYHDHV